MRQKRIMVALAAFALLSLIVGYVWNREAPSDRDLHNRAVIAAYEERCNNDEAEYCAKLGTAYILGLSVRPSNRKGLAALRRGCTLEHAQSCDMLGFVIQRGRVQGWTNPYSEVKNAYERACAFATEGYECVLDEYADQLESGLPPLRRLVAWPI